MTFPLLMAGVSSLPLDGKVVLPKAVVLPAPVVPAPVLLTPVLPAIAEHSLSPELLSPLPLTQPDNDDVSMLLKERRASAQSHWPLLGAVVVLPASILVRQWLLAVYLAYERAALAMPILTKSATSAVAYALGDVVAQRLTSSDRTRALDRGRIIRSTLAGGISHGPQLHFWSLLLEHFLGPGQVVRKILLDQTLFGLYINGAYTATTEGLKGASPATVWKRVRETSWPSLRASWKFWPAVHAITYSVVPLHLRVLWIDVVEVAWVAILSSCVSASANPEERAPSSELVREVSPPAPTPLQRPLDTTLPPDVDLYDLLVGPADGPAESLECCRGVDRDTATS